MTWIADVVLAFTAIECGVLLRFGGRWGLDRGDVVGMLLPGACLVMALREALGGQSVVLMAGALLLALMAHVHDVWRRRRR